MNDLSEVIVAFLAAVIMCAFTGYITYEDGRASIAADCRVIGYFALDGKAYECQQKVAQ